MERGALPNLSISISDMKRVLGAVAWLVLGVALCVLVLELLFMLLPVSKGLLRVDDPAWPLKNYESHVRYAYSARWDMHLPRRGVTNNFGHLAPFDYRPDRHPIVVIGDSYIESKMNRYEDTLQGQLGELLGQRERVFGLGASGLSISDYLGVAQAARTAFQPQAQVFLIVDGDLAESLIPRRGWRHFIQMSDGGWEVRYEEERAGPRSWSSRLLAQSSLYRYLRANLGFSMPEVHFQRGAAREVGEGGGKRHDDRRLPAAIDYFFEELKRTTAVSPECTVFLLDSDRYPLYGLPASPSVDSREIRAYFSAKAEGAGFQVVDLAPEFAAAYARTGKRFDYSPIDRHWNREGHAVAARAVKQALTQCNVHWSIE